MQISWGSVNVKTDKNKQTNALTLVFDDQKVKSIDNNLNRRKFQKPYLHMAYIRRRPANVNYGALPCSFCTPEERPHFYGHTKRNHALLGKYKAEALLG